MTVMEHERNGALVRDSEQVRWFPRARIDKFTLDSVEACRAWHGLDREPNGPELLAWAEATRGERAGDEYVEDDGNLLTRLGLRRLGALFIGETATASQALNATHMRIGVGNSSTAAATTDTDLGAAAGSGNRQFKLVDSVAQGTGANSGVSTAIATFATGQANFAWAEWGIDGGTADSTTVTSETASTPGLCNHKITSLGTKTSAAVWVFSVTITIAQPMTVARVAASDCTNTSVTTTVTATFAGGATTAGNLLLALVMCNKPGGSIAMTGWTLAKEATNLLNTQSMALFYKISTGDTTAVATSATGTTTMQIHAYEFSGIANPVVVTASDKNSSISTATSLTTGPTGITLSAANADNLVFVGVFVSGGSNGGGTSWATATILKANVTNQLMAGQYLPAAPLTAFNDTATWTTLRNAGALIAAFAESETAKSDTETGTATDAGESIAAAVSDAETGAGTDAGESLAVALSETESATGTDAGESIAAALSDTEAGTATDTEFVAPAVTDADTGAASDAGEALAVALTDTETGTAVEAEAVAVTFADGDSATATEGESVAVAFNDSDSGTAIEVEALAIGITDDDSAVAVDAEQVAVAVADSEAALAVEFAAIVAQLTDVDSGIGNDEGMVTVTHIGGWIVGAVHL